MMEPRVNIVGVQFRKAGKIYDFLAGETKFSVGDAVVVETERGQNLAKVAQLKAAQQGQREMRPILRKATEKDLSSSSRLDEDECKAIASQKVKTLGLDMRVLDVEIQFGGGKVLVYFTAPARVDFRELVKQLASAFKARVELKQVGARDETKILGGVGICGKEFCCSSFLREFVPVSIKMAKNQNLALNPTKVSGGCGRLLCCLTYENDVYTELKQKLPPLRSQVKTHDGRTGTVVRADLLNQRCAVDFGSIEPELIAVSQLEVVGRSNQQRKEYEVDESAEDWAADIDIEALTE